MPENSELPAPEARAFEIQSATDNGSNEATASAQSGATGGG